MVCKNDRTLQTKNYIRKGDRRKIQRITRGKIARKQWKSDNNKQ